MNAYSIFPLGDQAVSFELAGSEVDPAVHRILMAMKGWLEENAFDGMRDVVIGYRSISVLFDLFQVATSGVKGSISEFVSGKLQEAYAFANRDRKHSPSRHVKIPVCYSRKCGLDLDAVCERNKLTFDELVERHTAITYNVYLIGFLPGFPYLGFVDPRLEVPRHASPRSVVPAGSVGIAGKQTGIYPLDSPGGWQIIGRTPLKLFDPLQTPPVKIEAGDTVSFVSISEDEFEQLTNPT